MRKPPAPKKVSRLQMLLAGIGIITCVVFGVKTLGWVVSAPQQDGPSDLALHPERQDQILAERRAAALQEELGLSDEQTRQVARIVAEVKRRTDAGISDTSKDLASKMTAGQAMRDEAFAKISELLNDEQKKKFEAYLNERRARFGAFRNFTGASNR